MSNNRLEILLALRDEATKKLKASLGTVNSQVSKTSEKMATLGQSIKKHWLAATAALASFVIATRAIVDVINTFNEFEQGLINIKILLGDSKHEIALFEKEIKQLATTFGVTTQELNKSAFDIQSAVGDTTKSLKILNAATELSVAGGAAIFETTKGLVTLLESYGKELKGAADGADLLFIAQVRARATIGELSEAAGSFLPLGAKLGVSAEDILASFSKMTVVLGNVSESATAMNGILNGLIKPTAELKDKVKEWFGVTVQQAVAQGKFLDIMEKLGTVSEEEIGRMIPRIRGLKGLLAVSQDINSVREFAIEFGEREGQVQAALNDQMKTGARQMKIFVAEIEDLKIALGGLIVSTGVLKGITDFLRFLKTDGIETMMMFTLATRGLAFPVGIVEKIREIYAAMRGEGGEEPSADPTGGIVEKIIGDTDAAEERLSTFVESTMAKQQTLLENLTEMWEAYGDEKLASQMIRTQQETEFMQFALQNQINANQSMWVTMGKLRDTFSKGMSTSFVNIIKGTQTASEAFQALGWQMVQILIDFALQKAVNFALSKVFSAGEIAAAAVTGPAVAAFWAPAAANVAIATLGGAVGPASAALGTVHALAAALSIPKLEDGGIIRGSSSGRLIIAGENNKDEAIIPLTKGMPGGTTYINVEINNPSIRSDSDIDDLVEAVSRQLAYETDRIR